MTGDQVFPLACIVLRLRRAPSHVTGTVSGDLQRGPRTSGWEEGMGAGVGAVSPRGQHTRLTCSTFAVTVLDGMCDTLNRHMCTEAA